MKVVLDTCVWSLFFRGAGSYDDPIRTEIRELIRADRVQMLGCIRQELLSGAQPQERFDRLQEYLRFFPNLPVNEEDDENAAKCFNLCRSKGVQGGMFDLLICAQAIRHGLSIFTTDSDFERFAAFLPIELHSPKRRR